MTKTSISKFRREGRLAVDIASSNNSFAHKKFAKDDLGLGSMQCISHSIGNPHLFCFVFLFHLDMTLPLLQPSPRKEELI